MKNSIEDSLYRAPAQNEGGGKSEKGKFELLKEAAQTSLNRLRDGLSDEDLKSLVEKELNRIQSLEEPSQKKRGK